jgi:predicted PurR-regulated permease PerM
MGGFFALFFLYYVLSDWHRLSDWVGGHLGVPDDLGGGIVDDTTNLIRRAFYALTLSSVVTAVLIGLTMLLLDLPLALVVALVTFVTSYIPYLGAIFSGIFGFLVALGAGGRTDAVILLLVILIVQNVVQTIVGNRLTSSQLSLHPIASLIATLVGAAVAGLLGAILAAPVLAVALAVQRRIRAYEPERNQELRDRIEAGDVALPT